MDFIGYIAAFLTTFAFVPQAIKTINTRDTNGLSLGMYACMTVGIVCWLLHGIYQGDLALIGANAITLFLALPIFFITFSNHLKTLRNKK